MCLINIIENGNLESKPIAKNLLNLVDHEFICLLTVCNSILSSIDCVNVFLQKKKNNDGMSNSKNGSRIN